MAEVEAAIVRTAERFARATRRRADYWYVVGKLRGDPSTRALAARAPLGDVLDVGCGRGQLATLLLESRAARSVVGFDWDEAKVALAARAAEGLAARFFCADAREAELPTADTVMLVDVLHYFEAATQDALLARAARAVRPGGRLFVREASLGHGLRSTLTVMAERLGTFFGVNRGERVACRDVARELVPALEAHDMACAVEPCWSGTPFGNVLLVAQRA